jgi:hypothetical protein
MRERLLVAAVLLLLGAVVAGVAWATVIVAEAGIVPLVVGTLSFVTVAVIAYAAGTAKDIS